MEKKSPHILNASSNLLGFCLLIITSLKISKISGSTYVDDIAAVASLSLVVSCFLSFLAIRTENDALEKKYEKYGSRATTKKLAESKVNCVLRSFVAFYILHHVQQ